MKMKRKLIRPCLTYVLTALTVAQLNLLNSTAHAVLLDRETIAYDSTPNFMIRLKLEGQAPEPFAGETPGSGTPQMRMPSEGFIEDLYRMYKDPSIKCELILMTRQVGRGGTFPSEHWNFCGSKQVTLGEALEYARERRALRI